MTKQRLEYIDLAKGICIILVVFFHTCSSLPDPLGRMLQSFRMPLYFIISGMFFNTYSGMGEFVVKKINKLLIPFIFWSLLGFIISAIINERSISFQKYFICLWNEQIPNIAVWFLLCLFICSLFFYCIVLASNKFKLVPSILIVITLSFVIGISGFFMGAGETQFSLNLPLLIDSAMTALPFYSIGYFIRNYSDILTSTKFSKYWVLISVVLFGLTFFAGHSDIMMNDMSQTSFCQYYLSGFVGTSAVLLLSKKVKHIPFVSYWGRNSICILVTHLIINSNLLVPIGDWSAEYFKIDIRIVRIVFFVLLMFSYQIIIPFMQRFLPYVCAHKDLIKFYSK